MTAEADINYRSINKSEARGKIFTRLPVGKQNFQRYIQNHPYLLITRHKF